MILKKVQIPGDTMFYDITIRNKRIVSIHKHNPDLAGIDFLGEVIVFPGLINMHDHLSMNFFTPFKSRVYKNYIRWSEDLHRNNQQEIDQFHSFPKSATAVVGELKNLLCGFTTVCDHEQMPEKTFKLDSFTAFNYLHSIQRNPKWKAKLNFKHNQMPWLIHLNEGFDDSVEKEHKRLNTWNIFKRKIVAIHGISIPADHHQLIDGLIWCPGSNAFLYDRTANKELLLKKKNQVFFGSDSSLTGDPNIWSHIRYAIDYLGDTKAVFNMLTKNAAQYFNIHDRKAILAVDAEADIVIAEKTKGGYWDSFYHTNPENILMVIKGGEVVQQSTKLKLENHSLAAIKALETVSLVHKDLTYQLEEILQKKCSSGIKIMSLS